MKSLRTTGLAIGLGACILVQTVPAPAETASGDRWSKRWVYVSSNLYVNENIPKLEALFHRAKDAGYTGVLFTDYKTFTWWTLDASERWKTNAERVRQVSDRLGLELTVCVFPFGYAGSLLYHDVNLASGMPVRDAPLVARSGYLVPEQTAQIENGSFERQKGNRAVGFSFQDDPGESSFIDSTVVRDGRVSLRFENIGKVNPHGNGRICQKVRVRPWQQYRIRAWMKTDRLTGGEVRLAVLAKGRSLQQQHLSARDNKHQRYISGCHNLTTDWVEQSVTFNSLDNTGVNVYAGLWGSGSGTIWWDDLRLDAVPTLNVLRRESLPLSVVGEDGTSYEEGRDFEPVRDPKLGMLNPWPGEYETRHEPPRIKLTKTSRVKDGQRVRLSCYHCALVYGGQVNCSMDEPGVFDLCAQQMRKTREAFAPAGYFMSHDEVRSAGWEPNQTSRFKTSGELFAFNIRKSFELARREGGGRPVYVWSDMYDPHHNAHANYYLVNNTIAGSWEGLDRSVIVMKWGGGGRGRPGLQFFADRGHKQMIAAYYDGDVTADHRMWTQAARDIPDVIGVMYTTWRGDYSQLEKFAETWWGLP